MHSLRKYMHVLLNVMLTLNDAQKFRQKTTSIRPNG